MSTDEIRKCPVCETVLEMVETEDGGIGEKCPERYCNVGFDAADYDTGGTHWLKFAIPHALSGVGWRNFDRLQRSQHPIRYWLMDTVPDWFGLQKALWYDRPRDWLRYRTYNRYHRVSTGLEPGWNDVDNQMLYVSFTMLVNFIEVEKAHMMSWTDGVELNQKWWQKGPFDNWRSSELGLQHLEWEMKLTYDREQYGDGLDPAKYDTPTPQAEAAKEQYELYKWWTVDRPARVDCMDGSGLTAYYDARDSRADETILDIMADVGKNRTPEFIAMMHESTSIEERHEAEDVAQLVRLVKIKASLWT